MRTLVFTAVVLAAGAAQGQPAGPPLTPGTAQVAINLTNQAIVENEQWAQSIDTWNNGQNAQVDELLRLALDALDHAREKTDHAQQLLDDWNAVNAENPAIGAATWPGVSASISQDINNAQAYVDAAVLILETCETILFE